MDTRQDLLPDAVTLKRFLVDNILHVASAAADYSSYHYCGFFSLSLSLAFSGNHFHHHHLPIFLTGQQDKQCWNGGTLSRSVKPPSILWSCEKLTWFPNYTIIQVRPRIRWWFQTAIVNLGKSVTIEESLMNSTHIQTYTHKVPQYLLFIYSL